MPHHRCTNKTNVDYRAGRIYDSGERLAHQRFVLVLPMRPVWAVDTDALALVRAIWTRWRRGMWLAPGRAERVTSRIRRSGRHDGEKHVLQGIRVVDFSHIVAGPTCTRILADFGAEVIRVEFEQTLDYCRYIPPVMPGDGPNRSGSFNDINRNKLGVTLNAMHPKGMDLLQKLITVSDVVVENFSSRVLDIWGLDYDAQCKLRPDIIYASLSGFGHSGSNRDYTTWGPSAQALSGLTYMSGLPGEEPAGWGFSYMDLSGGYYGAIACLMALHHRNRTGEGQWVDMSQGRGRDRADRLKHPGLHSHGRPYRRPGNPPGTAPQIPRWPHTTPTAARAKTAGVS